MVNRIIHLSLSRSVHAYIIFKTEQAAEASLAHNMCVVGGNHIRVDRACPPRKKIKGENAPLYDNKRTVFAGNLPFDVKDEEIYQFFSGIKELESSIEAILVVRDPGTSMGKGIAYILFKTRVCVTVLQGIFVVYFNSYKVIEL
ncbi:nucleolar protein 12-like [Rhododendron vialii]|uniref:nucleolar protein 12-like n=1 Tax=Rhododendron vialii TaxID=182163 RepID=UPI00265EDB5B|nr:nucleolar protein 12-like [Rhododendron vialii]